MKMFEIYTPSTVAEVVSLLRDDAEIVAGATDWLVKTRGAPQKHVIDISGVDEMRGIYSDGKAIFIGALETMTAISESEILREHATCLCKAASSVGSWQIRNRATLGGNVANASPAADTPSALAALDAKAIFVTPKLITKFEIPLIKDRRSAFAKLGSRNEVSIARLNVAVSMSSAGNRVFVGTLGNAARRCPAAEALLGDKSNLGAFCDALSSLVDEAIPGRATQFYKRTAIRALGEEVFSLCNM